MTRIDEFITALHDEITYARKSTGKAFHLSHGSLQRRLGEYFIYNFVSHRPFTTSDDAPAKIEVDGKSYDCSVVSSQGLNLQLALKAPLGDRVMVAILISNQSQMLSALVEKFEQAKKTRSNIFGLAEDVFIGRTKALSAGDSSAGAYPRYQLTIDQADAPPNDGQKLAIINSYNNSLAIIWGAPGTGKTRTIARAVEAHLNAGRRILLVSHTNMAVDAAMLDIARQVQYTFYKEGQLLRLGVPKDAQLEQQFPMVLSERQVETATASLLCEQLRIDAEITAHQGQVEKCDRLLIVVDKVKELERKLQKPEESPEAKMILRSKQLQSEIDQAEKQLVTAQHHLKSVVGPAVYTYENVTKDLNIFIAVRQGMIQELNTKIAAQTGGESYETALERAYVDLDQMMEMTGLDPNQAIKNKKESQLLLTQLQTQQGPIKKQIAETQGKMLNNARLVATTLGQVFSNPTLEKEMFDILIVDDASMVPMPALFWALGKVSQGVTIVGDFKQLPPVAQAKTDMVAKWLRRTIFDELRIASVDAARKNARVSVLDTQYRLSGQITEVANQLFYEGLLKSAPTAAGNGDRTADSFSDSISADKALTMVDTSAVAHHCTQPPEGSRFNLYSAGLCATLCKKLLTEHPTETISIATPYRAQADLIDEMLLDADLQGRAQVSTVHKFQGGLATTVIFDCVDGLGSGHSLLDDRFKDSRAEVLLNAALTRAKCKFYLVVNKSYFFSTMSVDSLILKFIAAMGAKGIKIESRSIDDNFTARSIESDAPARSTKDTSTPGSLFNEKNFWDEFFNDLMIASESVLIASPSLTTKRSRLLVSRIEPLISRGVKVRLYTKPVAEHSQAYISEDAAQVISLLEKMGVEVLQLPDMQAKVAIIDDHICWEGSLNILSHTGSSVEHMRRLLGRATAAEIKSNLRM